MYRVLFLPAQPADASAELLHELPARITDQQGQWALSCRSTADTSFRQLSELLASFRPHIVHVHSRDGAAAMLVDGAMAWAASLLKRFVGIVRCLILDGCMDAQQAAALTASVDCVIGFAATVDAPQRARWSAAFYQALQSGLDLKSALHAAAQDAGAIEPAVQLGAGVQLAQLRLAEQLVPKPRQSRSISGDIAAQLPTQPQFGNLNDSLLSGGRDIAAAPGPAPHFGDVILSKPASASLAAEPSATPTAAAAARYLNAGFFRGKTLIPTNQALDLASGPLRLGVNVGSFWSPGERGAPVPDGLLARLFQHRAEVALDVMVRSPEVAISPPVQQLRVAARGDSDMLFFALTFAAPGHYALSVDLLFHGHLLQSRSVECEVVADAAAAANSAGKPQDGRITFTRTAELDPQALAQLEASPRQLTIVAEREQKTNSIGLRIYDSTQGELERCDTRLTDTSLVKALKVLRERLAAVMGAYQGGIGGTPAELCQHLGMLADVGRRFYRALLPDAEGADAPPGSRANRFALAPGSIIQVAPLSAQLSVPWELLYERPFESYRPETTRLCATFKEHAPADCPDKDDPQVVCPHGFWGYRYIIEQLPCRTLRDQPRTEALPTQIENHKPLELCAIVNTRLRMVDRHIAALRALNVMNVVQVDTLAGLKQELVSSPRHTDFVYFYTHGGADDFGSPYLEIGKDTRIESNDLDAWGIRFPQRPLVFMNACDSASYSPDQFDDLIQLLCSRGAAGVIGTQCEVREVLANEFVLLFLKSFLRRIPAGQALFDVRHALLAQGDPRGLAYSLFAAAEVRLEQKLL